MLVLPVERAGSCTLARTHARTLTHTHTHTHTHARTQVLHSHHNGAVQSSSNGIEISRFLTLRGSYQEMRSLDMPMGDGHHQAGPILLVSELDLGTRFHLSLHQAVDPM